MVIDLSLQKNSFIIDKARSQNTNVLPKNSFIGKDQGVSPCPLNAHRAYSNISFSSKAIDAPALKRDPIKPMLTDKTVSHLGDYFAAFNPGAIEDGKGGSHLLIRAVRGESYPEPPFYSDLIYGHSKDGKNIEKDSLKVMIEPNEQFPNGFEDPRITKFEGDDKHYIVCTGYDSKFPRICLWTTTDLTDKAKYKFEGPIGPEQNILQPGTDDKDAFLHNEKVDGQFMLYHRIGKNIQAVFADSIDQLKDQDFWKEQLEPETLEKNTIMKNKPKTWENKLGGGPPPIRTDAGWLMLNHSSDKSGPGRQYCGGVVLLDIDNPLKVIARAPDPIIKPETPYEKNGPVPGVVFPQGLVQNDDNLLVYYGCGDKNVGVAETKVSELVEYVKQFDADGNIKAKEA